ncbi:MAG: glycosyltransferase [Burkholderiales bacterium]
MADAMATTAVLHVTSAEGGGADRYIRDLAATTRARHWIWHVTAGVIEDVANRRFHRADEAAALGRFVTGARIGAVHLHGVSSDCAAALAAVGAARTMPYLLTLHDIGFVAPHAFDGDESIDPDQIARVEPIMAGADAVIAPSRYLASLVARHFPGVEAREIAPGIDARANARATPRTPPADFTPQAKRLRIGVVGAIGPHKGSGELTAFAAAIAPLDATLVIIGYTDSRVEPGWIAPGALYLHGAYADGALASWLDAYGVALVLFANRLPESFSYTLSEAWAARRPVIVPDAGALGERVARGGGGWRLPQRFTPAELRALVTRLAGAEGAREIAQVESAIDIDDAVRIPTLAAMTQAFDRLYARYAAPGAADGSAEALAPLVAANLDGTVFRRELVRLTDELVETRAWCDKLQRDIDELKAAVERLGDDNRQLADIRDAFGILPRSAQKYLLKRAFRGRG